VGAYGTAEASSSAEETGPSSAGADGAEAMELTLIMTIIFAPLFHQPIKTSTAKTSSLMLPHLAIQFK